jgi:hypothetical protein
MGLKHRSRWYSDWRSDVSRLDDDQQLIDDTIDTVQAMTGCAVSMSANTALDDARGVWVRSNDDAILRRFRRTR